MQASSSPWPWPTPATSGANPLPLPYLHSTVSMANLHAEPDWQKWKPPPSPTSSTASSASRSTTPTNSTMPHSLTNNPWANSMLNLNLNSPPTSPGDPKAPSPPSTSRCATPVAPQAIRPNPAIVAAITTNMVNEARPQARVSPTSVSFPELVSPTPNPYKQAQAAAAAPPLPANIISPNLVAYMTRSIPNILIRLNWESSKAQRFYCWAVPNPKTVLLFWMCDDLLAWPRALFFGLDDSMLPYREADLQGIAADPRKAVQNQWRVMIKELPRAGQHTEFQPKEAVPLQPVGTLRPMSTQSKIVEKVRWIGEDDSRIYVRKQFATSRQSQKSTLFQQLQQFKRLDHGNLARIVCTYTYGSTFSVITNAAQYNLDEYLQVPADSTRQQIMMNWVYDLTDALAYIHSKEMHHGCLRPRKILVDGSRVLFSAFGFFNSTIVGSSREPDAAQAEEEAYIYAAPELIAHRKVGRAGDVFSLGCILLAILSVVKGQTVASFQHYRSSNSHDPSFHANIAEVSSWVARLQTLKNSSSGQRRERAAAAELHALEFIKVMLVQDASKRMKMKKLVRHVAQWNESRLITRRRSLERMDSIDTGRWVADLGPLNSYYHSH